MLFDLNRAEYGTVLHLQEHIFWWLTISPLSRVWASLTHSLTHCCAWPARAVATSTMSDPAPMTTASQLCTRDLLPPVVSRSSLAGQVDASSPGQGICPARGWRSAGGCCGLAHLVVGGKHVSPAVGKLLTSHYSPRTVWQCYQIQNNKWDREVIFQGYYFHTQHGLQQDCLAVDEGKKCLLGSDVWK